MSRLWRVLQVGTAVAGVGFATTDARQRRRVRAVFEAAGRAAALVGVVGVITLDYKLVGLRTRLVPRDSAQSRSRARVLAAEQELIEADLVAKNAEQRLSAVCADSESSIEVRKEAELQARTTMAIAAEAAEALVQRRKDAQQVSVVSGDIDDAHQRAADRLLWLARTNRGVYIKLAQHMAQLDYLLPDAYTRTLRACFDDAPQSCYEDVCEVVLSELGKHPEALFHTFNRTPIASASLAQVHEAYLRTAEGQRGARVAVKVQHLGLRDTATGDVDAVTGVVRVLQFLWPRLELWYIR
jgi:predicted unusual protein kinase regulating ubiquinone biosynthesis (AarF/ABC1/UbiB family)